MALWCRVRGVDPVAWARAGEARGILFQIGPRFSFEGRKIPYVRLGFAGLDERGLAEAAARMHAALADLRRAAT